jgi:hypothetical protein
MAGHRRGTNALQCQATWELTLYSPAATKATQPGCQDRRTIHEGFNEWQISSEGGFFHKVQEATQIGSVVGAGNGYQMSEERRLRFPPSLRFGGQRRFGL